MGDSMYDRLKSSLSSIPIKALNLDCREILSKNLDEKQDVPSKLIYPRDFRGLAEVMGIPHIDSKKFESYNEPTLKILDARPDVMLGDLIGYLEKIERFDVIEDLIPCLDEQAGIFHQFQKDSETSIQVSEEEDAEAKYLNERFQASSVTSNIDGSFAATSCPMRSDDRGNLITLQDLTTGECTIYDAYVCYADDDIEFVQDLANFLESPEIGMKLFIRGRDMLAGSPELDTNIELIKNRCRRMLIILTKSFVQSSQCAFQISFATSLSIEQKERILVPILVTPCDIPSVLLIMSKIDFTKSAQMYEWMWQRLIASLLPQKRMFVSSRSNLPAQPYQPPNPEPVSTTKSPVITFPETVRLSAIPVDQTSSRIASLANPAKNSPITPVGNQSKDESVEPKCLLEDSASGKVATDNDSTITAVQGLAQPITESSASIKSCKASPKPLRVVSEKIPVTRKIKNAFCSYFKSEPSASSSFSSTVTSGYHSESTFLTN